MPNKLSQFWQELKRRNVVRVITVYAGAAFVIIELINNITEPLHLPEWTPTLVIVLLAIGFPVVIIFSWIYDVHPEGGIVKTEPDEKAGSENTPKSYNGWKIASIISFIVIIGFIALNVVPQSGKLVVLDKSIAVLPFENLSEEKGNEFFVDGLVEDLLNRISVIEELKVISRTSSEMYRERGVKTVPQIAEELKVSYILEGSVRRYGNNARITVQLIDARIDHHVWAKNYDRNIDDVFQTQSEIATHIATELDAILTSREKAMIQEDKTTNIKAFELYQMGRFYWNKRTGDGYKTSIEYFDQAIETDPGYGLAYAGLADSYILMAIQGHIDRREGRDKGEELALRALELDGNLAEAYAVLGEMYDYIDWNWGQAEEMYQRALELNPNYSTGHHYYSEHLSFTGQHEEARAHINRAKELNPLSFVIRFVSAKLFFHQGEFEDALRELVICDEIQEGHRWIDGLRWQICWLLGREDEAYESYRNLLSSVTHFDLDFIDGVYNRSGFSGVLSWVVDRNISFADNDRNYTSIASDFAFLGKYEEAMDWLEKAYQFHQVSEQVFQIQFKPLQDNPRFQVILKGMGLAD